MLGNFHDNVINIECETNSADLYVVDAEGVYIENIAMHSYLESEIIDAINAKYGTNFTHLTVQKVTGIAIGDDCPNWDAYEKMSSVRYAIAFSNDLSVFGVLENTAFKVSCNGNNFYLIDGISGEIYSNQYYGDDFMNMLMSKLNAAGVNVSTMERSSVSYEIGTIVPDWYLYKLIR